MFKINELFQCVMYDSNTHLLLWIIFKMNKSWGMVLFTPGFCCLHKRRKSFLSSEKGQKTLNSLCFPFGYCVGSWKWQKKKKKVLCTRYHCALSVSGGTNSIVLRTGFKPSVERIVMPSFAFHDLFSFLKLARQLNLYL